MVRYEMIDFGGVTGSGGGEGEGEGIV